MTSSTTSDNELVVNTTALSTPPHDDNCHRTTSEGEGSSGIQSSSVGGSASALSSPLLNGEHIVLLSLSNDNTPIDNDNNSNNTEAEAHEPAAVHDDNINDSDRTSARLNLISISTPPVPAPVGLSSNSNAASRSGFEVIERRDQNPNLMMQMMASSTDMNIEIENNISPAESELASGDNDGDNGDDNIGNIIINDPQDNNDGNSNNEAVYSPPPDSIIHSDLQSLSPPPLSFKSDSHHQYNVHHSPHSQSRMISSRWEVLQHDNQLNIFRNDVQ